ncbi:MAG: diguanylate cyclase [Mariprofundales bacterium]
MIFKRLRSSLMGRLLLYAVPVTLLLGFLIYQAFFTVVVDSVTELAWSYAEQKVLYYNDKTTRIILREKGIVERLSVSQELVAWAMDESNTTLQAQALNLLEQHRPSFHDGSYFFVVDQSGHYYYNNKANGYAGKQLRYTLSPDTPKDAWYFATKKRGQRCQINVETDRKLGVTKIWINCLVRHGGDVVGVMGTGIDLTEFIHEAVESHQAGVNNIYTNQQGRIQAASEVSMIDFASLTHDTAAGKNIFSLLDRKQDRVAIKSLLETTKQKHQPIATMEAKIYGAPYIISMQGIPEIGWVNVTMVDIHQQRIGKYFIPMAILIAIGMTLIFALLIIILNRLVLSRLHRLDKDIRTMESGDYTLRGVNACSDADEIGRLTVRFSDMAAAVSRHTVQLEEAVVERTMTLKQSKQKLRAEHAQLDAVISNAVDGIIHINAQGIIQSFNPAAEGMFGYEQVEVLGQNIRMLMPEPDHSQHDGYLSRYMETRVRHIIGHEREVMALRKDGSTFAMSLRVNTMQLEGEDYFIGMLQDITERKLAEETINKLAYFDSLTGLPNRRMFMDRMGQALARTHRNKTGFSLLFLDLDGFKAVNDSLGHKAGDQVLTVVADRLRSCAREMDTVARLGGDEFTIILSDIMQREPVAIVADKIIAALGEPIMTDGSEFHLGASIGIAICPTDSDTLDALIHCADNAMYAAKKAGKNQYLFCGNRPDPS